MGFVLYLPIITVNFHGAFIPNEWREYKEEGVENTQYLILWSGGQFNVLTPIISVNFYGAFIPNACCENNEDGVKNT